MQKTLKTQCAFCDPKVKQIQEVFRTAKTRVIYPRGPVIKENLLIIPIRHVEEFQDLKAEEVVDIFKVVRKISGYFRKIKGMSGFNLFVNNDKCAGQHVPHIHFHYFARSEDEKISPFKILNNPGKYKVKGLTDQEIQSRVAELKHEFSQN